MKVYLDHSATTPVLQEVYDAMAPFFCSRFGNASSNHFYGKEARKAVENARETIASIINCLPDEIFFTSGGTESNNIGILGLTGNKKLSSVITSEIEHEAVLGPVDYLQNNNHNVHILGVNKEGIVDFSSIKEYIRENSTLVSIMYANNEMGSVQPIGNITKITKKLGVIFHTDAVQAMGKLKIDTKELGIDMLSASAHKFYGPKGIGFLFVKKGTPVAPIVFGGGHERDLRSGTENVPGIVGMAEALKICHRDYEINNDRFIKWKKMIISEFQDQEDFRLNQNTCSSLPNIINMSFRGFSGESIAEMLNLHDIAVSTSSACASHHKDRDDNKSSRVLEAMGIDKAYSASAIRVSTGIDNDDKQIIHFIDSLKEILKKLRSYNDDF